MGKTMVAEGLGVTVLPDYSLDGDPLTSAGVLTHRPIADVDTTVSLLMANREVATAPTAVREMQDALLLQAHAYATVTSSSVA
jgi:DNA-binding transcriptional LysR family regulator